MALKVFISYSWDSEEHKEWVLKLADNLSKYMHVIFDQYDLKPGDDLTKFMEDGVESADKVLVILTPVYKEKAEERVGGVGYEYSMITQELFDKQGSGKFIPLLISGNREKSVPKFIKSKLYLDMVNDKIFEENVKKILKYVNNEPLHSRPKIGSKYSKETSRNDSNERLIDNHSNLKKCKMTSYASWMISVQITPSVEFSKEILFRYLNENVIKLKETGQLLPYILSPNYKLTHSPEIIYENPLMKYSAENHLVNEKMKIDSGLIHYEFSEYNDQDKLLLLIYQPILSLLYFLAILSRIHFQLKKEIDISIDINFNSNRSSYFHWAYSPFDIDFLPYESYIIPRDIELKKIQLKEISKGSLYEMFSRIYNTFESKNPRSLRPYIFVDRKKFDSKINDLIEQMDLLIS